MAVKKLEIREIEVRDNAEIQALIKQVLEEYGDAKPGTAYFDPELGSLAQFYAAKTCRKYWVVTAAGRVVGGCGVAEFDTQGTAELQKLYFLPEFRGLGLGKRLVNLCEEFARQAGFKSLYLETLSNMHEAVGLYQHLGFEPRSHPRGETEHPTCDIWLEKLI